MKRWLLFALCTTAACAQRAAPEVLARPAEAPSAPVTSTAPARTTSAPTTVRGDALQALSQRSLAALGAESRLAVSQSPLPVLLFSDPAAASASIVTAGEQWYAISARVGALTLSLHATHEQRNPNGDDPLGHTERVRGAPAMPLFNEGVRSVTWSENGATYALEVECSRPFEDRECTERDYVLTLAETLVRAGAVQR